jgi:hypothetical protein
MPPLPLQILTTDGDPAAPISITGLSGGEESAVTTLDIWNDKLNVSLDPVTRQDMFLKILASSSGGPYVSTGVPLLDEQWSRVRITHTLSAAGASTEGASDTLAVGTNSEFPLPDLAPQTGVRIEFQVIAPAGSTADAVKIKLQPVGNQGSSPLARFVGLAHGSGVIPADRIAGLRAILRGSEITADDTDTITIGRGSMTHDGTVTTFLADSETFTLADGAAVDLDAAESYNVTLSRTGAAALVVTKGPKTEAVLFPAVPANNVLVSRLVVESTDGIAVTVSQASVDQSEVAYAQFLVRDGGGLNVIVAPGDGITSSDFRQPSSHGVPVALDALATSGIWRLAAGAKVATLTDVPPEFNADLLALVTTDASTVTSIVDARRFTHRALVMDRLELVFRDVLTGVSAPAHGLAWVIAHGDFEIESVELNLSATDTAWTGGAVKIDVRAFAPGAAVPFPVGGTGTGGASIFTNSGTDDARPSIAFDATNLRAVSVDHEVRRIVDGTRLLLSLFTTVAGPGGEPQQEVRVTLHVRRYR